MDDDVIVVCKRGDYLTGYLHKDTNRVGYPYYAEVNYRGEVFKSQYYYDEDMAAAWISEKFDELTKRNY